MRFGSLKLLLMSVWILSAAACSSRTEFGFATQWLTPSKSLDTELVKEIFIFENDDAVHKASWTTAKFTAEDDIDGDGRIEKSFPLLDFGVPTSFTLEGRGENGQAVVLGRTREITLREGERRVVGLTMYKLNEANEMPTSPLPSIMGSATTLLDGRVLIAGGFSQVSSMECPSDAPDGSTCYELSATSDAYIFEPASGQLLPEAPLLTARGGHTATRLDSGRVVIAGGAERAMVIVSPSPAAELVYEFRPLGSANALEALSTIEIFDPNLDLAPTDPEGDGDPTAGGFVDGANFGDTAASMGFQRFLHAAVHLGGDRVFFAGGYSGDGGTQSFEVFNDLRPGGAGTESFGSLQRPRRLPGAVLAGDTVWIVGGTDATSKADVAELWEVDRAETTLATSKAGFAGTSDDILAQLAVMRPSLVTVQVGANVGILVIGSAGTRCALNDEDELLPVFDLSADFCPAVASGGGTSPLKLQTISPQTGIVVSYPDKVPSSSYGSVVQFEDQSIASIGGIHDGETEVQISLYKPEFVGNNALGEQKSVLLNPRGSVFTSVAPLAGNSLLIVGGADVTASGSFELLTTPIVHQRERN